MVSFLLYNPTTEYSLDDPKKSCRGLDGLSFPSDLSDFHRKAAGSTRFLSLNCEVFVLLKTFERTPDERPGLPGENEGLPSEPELPGEPDDFGLNTGIDLGLDIEGADRLLGNDADFEFNDITGFDITGLDDILGADRDVKRDTLLDELRELLFDVPLDDTEKLVGFEEILKDDEDTPRDTPGLDSFSVSDLSVLNVVLAGVFDLKNLSISTSLNNCLNLASSFPNSSASSISPASLRFASFVLPMA